MNAPPLQQSLELDAGAEQWANEKELQRAVMRWLREQGALTMHLTGFFDTQAGWPDVICLAPDGRLLLVELKRATGKLRPAQTDFILKADRIGHAVHVCRQLREVQEHFANLYLQDATMPCYAPDQENTPAAALVRAAGILTNKGDT
ncbi:MAG: VRR-NUC domain-containing protein [bacterium]|nr:VRR-NUC domain-containing protein [bacterium]